MTPFGEEWYVDTDDGCCRLYIVEKGDGPTVIVLHGGPAHSHGYLAAAVKNLTNDYRVVLYDQRGALFSPCDVNNISLAKNVADLEQLRQELGSDDPVRIVAHSTGTVLAMAYVEQHHDSVLNLSLLGSHVVRYPSVEEFERYGISLVERSSARVKEIEQKAAEQLRIENLDGEISGARDLTRRWRIKFAAGNIHHANRWRQFEGGRIHYNETNSIATARTFPNPDTLDFTAALKTFDRPVTFINGDAEHIRFNTSFWNATLEPLPNAKLVVLNQAGHNAWIDQPKRFENELRDALTRV